MSKSKYLCFDCKVAIKRDPYQGSIVKCSTCGNDCINIGMKIPVPPKSKPKLWDSLRVQLINEHNNEIKSRTINAVQRRHELEKEIDKLEALPVNSGRKSLIKGLRSQLAAINA